MLDMAYDDYTGILEVRNSMDRYSRAIKSLLSKGLISLHKRVEIAGKEIWAPIKPEDYETALSRRNWDPDLTDNHFIAFTTTEEGDRVYEAGGALP